MDKLRASMGSVAENFLGEVGGYLPNLVAALLVLIIGWLVAYLVSRLVRAALKRTSIDNRIAAWVRGEEGTTPDVEPAIGRIVFWFLMIFVLVAFFQVLQLTIITEPLNKFLSQIFEYAPRLLSAGVLLLVAWLIASGVRLVVRTALGGLKLDERVGSEVGEDGRQVSLSSMLSETVYWLVFLLFLPAVLDALQLEGLLAPVRQMVGKLLDFLPNLFAAAIIFLIGWFIAKIVQRIVSNLLGAVGLDAVGDRVGLNKVMGRQRLSGLLGLLLYTLILIPVLISSLNALKLDAITRPASQMLDQILGSLPGLFGAALILTIAYVIGRVVGGLVSNLLGAAGFDRMLEKVGFSWKGDGTEQGRASGMVGHLVVVLIMLFAAVEALNLLAFAQLSTLVSSFIVFFGNVLLGVAIFGLGLYLANLAARAIESGGQNPLVATAAKVAIMILAGAMALGQMGLAENIINLAFGLILGAAAVAAAIAFGMGGRDLARQELERWSDDIKRRGN